MALFPESELLEWEWETTVAIRGVRWWLWAAPNRAERIARLEKAIRRGSAILEQADIPESFGRERVKNLLLEAESRLKDVRA